MNDIDEERRTSEHISEGRYDQSPPNSFKLPHENADVVMRMVPSACQETCPPLRRKKLK